MYENLKWISHAFCDCEKKTNYGNEPNDGCKCHAKKTMWRAREKRDKKCNSAAKQQLRLDACNSHEKTKLIDPFLHS